MFAHSDCASRLCDGKPILVDYTSFGDLLKGYFVPCRNVLQEKERAIALPFLDGPASDTNMVAGVDSDNGCQTIRTLNYRIITMFLT